MNIYQAVILDHYHNPHNFGDMTGEDRQSHAVNSICGDKITMKVKIEKGKIVEIKFSGSGCAISMASASLLTDAIKGKPLSFLKKLQKDFILDLLGIDLSPNRLKCALLPLEAAQKLITKK